MCVVVAYLRLKVRCIYTHLFHECNLNERRKPTNFDVVHAFDEKSIWSRSNFIAAEKEQRQRNDIELSHLKFINPMKM